MSYSSNLLLALDDQILSSNCSFVLVVVAVFAFSVFLSWFLSVSSLSGQRSEPPLSPLPPLPPLSLSSLPPLSLSPLLSEEHEDSCCLIVAVKT